MSDEVTVLQTRQSIWEINHTTGRYRRRPIDSPHPRNEVEFDNDWHVFVQFTIWEPQRKGDPRADVAGKPVEYWRPFRIFEPSGRDLTSYAYYVNGEKVQAEGVLA